MIRKGSGDKCDRSNEVTEKYAQACQKVSTAQIRKHQLCDSFHIESQDLIKLRFLCYSEKPFF